MPRLFVRFVSVAAIALIVLAGCGEKSDGALQASEWPTSATIGSVVDVGTAVSFGGPMMLINGSTADVTIEKVEFDKKEAGVSDMGWVLRDVGTRSATGGGIPFPPVGARPGGARTITPNVVRNDAGELLGETEVVVGLRLDVPGVFTARGVRVTYTDRTGRHTVVYPLTMVLCGPKADHPAGCPSATGN